VGENREGGREGGREGEEKQGEWMDRENDS